MTATTTTWPAFMDDDRRACLGVADPEVFFPEDNGAAPAKLICAPCPFRTECRDYAMAHDYHGVWGATTKWERDGLKARRAGAVDRPCAACGRMFTPRKTGQRACGRACGRQLGGGGV